MLRKNELENIVNQYLIEFHANIVMGRPVISSDVAKDIVAEIKRCLYLPT